MSEKCKGRVCTTLNDGAGYPCEAMVERDGYCMRHYIDSLKRRNINPKDAHASARDTALKLAAYRAGVKAAERECAEFVDYETRPDGSTGMNSAARALDSIRALHDPTPEQLEQIR